MAAFPLQLGTLEQAPGASLPLFSWYRIVFPPGSACLFILTATSKVTVLAAAPKVMCGRE